ncbi:hypothetical protein GCM10010123_26450 [Pilimelia anulata]|uniref:DUF6879 domain-containing protein n=1 Tax=Pilimelia anulata TaxID=53371 RepID=A0A8J3B5M1_9ACTN|nr:DUF6879 family protein [Pilimelia anulata]GGJ95366.1 hypothetical protein GCM10010123_26450 [Pilimelia anulata]
MVSEPISEYHRWIHSILHRIVAAGEETRWCSRGDILAGPLPGSDFYVLDGAEVMFLRYSGDGVVTGLFVTEDPAVVRFCSAVFEDVWKLATDHRAYRPRL